MTRLLASFTCASLLVGGIVAAQSLADVAKKEEQRRQEVGKRSPVYTNKDLKPVPPAGPGSGAAPAEDKAPATDTAPEGAPSSAQPAADAGGVGKPVSEEQWRTRMADARTELERTRMFADALQSRVNALWADFTARDDPGQRAAIETERQRALAELARVRNEIDTKTKAIADLEEEARKANVPPGWLR